MYLYNCVYGNKEDKDKKRKEAQGATNTEIILTHVHKREATEKACHTYPSAFAHL
jgi:hypothetical protein